MLADIRPGNERGRGRGRGFGWAGLYSKGPEMFLALPVYIEGGYIHRGTRME